MEFFPAGPAEGRFPLPGTTRTAPLVQETADNKEQEQSPQAPYQTQKRPQQRVHLGPFRGLVKPCRHQDPPQGKQHTKCCPKYKQNGFHRQSRLCDTVGVIPTVPVVEVFIPKSAQLF